MAVVVLDESVIAVIVAVEALAIFYAFGVAYFVILDDGIIAGPGPYAGGVIFAALTAAVDEVVFYYCAVAAPGFDGIATAVEDGVAADDDVCAREPVMLAVDEAALHAYAVAVCAC